MGSTVIEFCGLPGCGKTTLSNKVLSDCGNGLFHNENDFYEFLKKRRGFINSMAYSFSPSFLHDIVFFVYCLVKSDHKKEIAKRCFKIFRYKGLCWRNHSSFILSEGYLQAVLELLDNIENYDLESKNYLSQTIIRDLNQLDNSYVIVECEKNICKDRIVTRDSEPNSIDMMSVETRAAFMEKREKNTIALFRFVKEHLKNDRYIAVDSRDSIEYNSNCIIAKFTGEK